MTNTLTRYSAALLPLAVLVLGVLDTAQRAGADLLGWQTITQIVLLIVTTGAGLVLPLVPGPWAGALKTGSAIAGAIVSALIAYVPEGHFTTATLILFLTAALKAVAVQIGVTIRTDAAKVVDARETPAGEVPVITSLGAAPAAVEPILDSDHQEYVPGDDDVLEPDDGLGVDRAAQPSTGPEHRADTNAV